MRIKISEKKDYLPLIVLEVQVSPATNAPQKNEYRSRSSISLTFPSFRADIFARQCMCILSIHDFPSGGKATRGYGFRTGPHRFGVLRYAPKFTGFRLKCPLSRIYCFGKHRKLRQKDK